MSFEQLTAVADPEEAGAWIGRRLRDDFGAVTRTVPSGFAAYARILHPVITSHPVELDVPPDVVPVGIQSWADVCLHTHRVPHALMQWHAISTPEPGVSLPLTPEGRWSEVDTNPGNLGAEALATLLEVLTPFTGPQDCYHALWEGYGWLHGGGWFLLSRRGDPRPEPERPPTPEALRQALNGPRLQLPGRGYLVFHGPLAAALRIGHQAGWEWMHPQSPNLLWPEDRSWCVASEIDFDSTLVGGSEELVDAVLRSPDLDAWAVEPDDDLSYFGDRINV